MIRLAPSSDSESSSFVNSLAQTAQMILNSEDIMRALTSSGPTPASAINVTQRFVKIQDFEGSYLKHLTGDESVASSFLKLSNLNIEEWDDLFAAVNRRLMQTVGLQLPEELGPNTKADPISAGVRTSVEECVQALELLHSTLKIERDKRQQLEKEAGDVQVVIAKTLVDLDTVPLP